MKYLVKAAVLCAPFFFCACAGTTQSRFSGASDYIDAIKNLNLNKEMADSPLFCWNSWTRNEVLYVSDHLVSFRIEAYAYTGGAHGMPCTRVGTLKDGVLLKLSDIPEQDKLKKAWSEAIARHYECKDFNEYMESAALFKPEMTENFYLDADGIHFIYDPYEIDCYAAGTIDIFVPWKTEPLE